MVVYTYYSSTQETEAGGWWVRGQPGLHSEILPQKTQTNKTLLMGMSLWDRSVKREGWLCSA
jgi:hypothetical protein